MGLKELGGGGQRDRLNFRLVVRILTRCLPLLRGLFAHLALFATGWGLLIMLVLPAVPLFLDLIWTRALQGEALAPFQAALLGYEPSEAVDVPVLAPELRYAVASVATAWAVAFAVLAGLGVAALVYYQIWILQQINQVLRVQLMDRIQTLSLRFHAESRIGDAIYRVYQDSAMVTGLIDVLFLTPLASLFRFAAAVLIVALLNWRLALLLAFVLPMLIGFGFVFSRALRIGFRRAREANSALTSRIQESVAGIKVIKAYGLEAFEQERFEASSRGAFSEAFSARSLLALFGVVVFWVVALGMVASTAAATLLTRDGSTPLLAQLGAIPFLERAVIGWGLAIWTLGIYNGFKWAFGFGTGGLQRLFTVWGRTQDLVIGLDRVFELLDLEPEVEDAPDAVPMPPFRNRIELRDVSFRYEPDRPVLDSVHLVVEAGTVTAIVGPTGSGKSTLMALLLRLFDPDRGEIRIDGKDIRGFKIESIRSQIAIALQENLLFGSTVRENICYFVPEATDAEFREAARVACVDEFAGALPRGYDTLLGERGTKLSTGQRQRISIARAVLKNTPILILDEPTASLDAETELSLLQNLTEWGKGRVIFLITHRLSTVRYTDQIVVLDSGRIREQGDHEDLMRAPDGVYRAMVHAFQPGGRALPEEAR
jgi:ABC-type multidrug transport system fused ATPase/permease subunit